MESDKTVLAFTAHPDDAEFLCAGVLALLRKQGWQIHISTMTPGDCGSTQHNREEISRIRKKEAAKSAEILGGTYHCLEDEDLYIMYDRPTLLKAIRLLRIVHPSIVITHSPSDYMIDHETSSKIAQSACFACGIPNIVTENSDPIDRMPVLYYADALEGKDKFGTAIVPSIVVDITSVIDKKEKMLCCHASQREWLQSHHGMDEYVMSMKRFSAQRGQQISVGYAEGFRQHLGHGYPQDNVLLAVLGEFVNVIKKEA